MTVLSYYCQERRFLAVLNIRNGVHETLIVIGLSTSSFYYFQFLLRLGEDYVPFTRILELPPHKIKNGTRLCVCHKLTKRLMIKLEFVFVKQSHKRSVAKHKNFLVKEHDRISVVKS